MRTSSIKHRFAVQRSLLRDGDFYVNEIRFPRSFTSNLKFVSDIRVFDRICSQIFVHTMIGTKLAHFEITTHIGSGGMGDVYQATDTKLGRSVAIKFLPDAFSQDRLGIHYYDSNHFLLAPAPSHHPNLGLQPHGHPS